MNLEKMEEAEVISLTRQCFFGGYLLIISICLLLMKRSLLLQEEFDVFLSRHVPPSAVSTESRNVVCINCWKDETENSSLRSPALINHRILVELLELQIFLQALQLATKWIYLKLEKIFIKTTFLWYRTSLMTMSWSNFYLYFLSLLNLNFYFYS